MLYKRGAFVSPGHEFTDRFFEGCLHSPERRAWLRSVNLGLYTPDLTVEHRRYVVDPMLSATEKQYIAYIQAISINAK